jgi:regulator of replication initiation timing
MSRPTPVSDMKTNILRLLSENAKLQRERDEAREIAGRLAHFLERPAYSVDEAIARMEALNSYKKQKSQ